MLDQHHHGNAGAEETGRRCRQLCSILTWWESSVEKKFYDTDAIKII
jgi:hypothetical protein